MKIALLSDANTPGLFHHMPLDWQVNGVEALAWALHADVWHGTELDDVLVNHFATYDVLIMNLKHTLWRAARVLADSLKTRVLLCGYQEGPSDLLGTLRAPRLDRCLEALRSLDVLFVYDRRSLGWFRKSLECEVSYLPLPAPLDVYARIRKPYSRRPAFPARVCLGQTLNDRRGTYLSVLVGAQDRSRVLCMGRDTREVGIAARLIAEAGGIPDCDGWLEWNHLPMRRFRGHSFLTRLADCSLAVNLDTAACYGRFVVDCAGLGVPCIGSRQTVMQAELFPSLTFDGYREFHKAAVSARMLLRSSKFATHVCEQALKTLEAKFNVKRVRRMFHRAMRGYLVGV